MNPGGAAELLEPNQPSNTLVLPELTFFRGHFLQDDLFFFHLDENNGVVEVLPVRAVTGVVPAIHLVHHHCDLVPPQSRLQLHAFTTSTRVSELANSVVQNALIKTASVLLPSFFQNTSWLWSPLPQTSGTWSAGLIF